MRFRRAQRVAKLSSRSRARDANCASGSCQFAEVCIHLNRARARPENRPVRAPRKTHGPTRPAIAERTGAPCGTPQAQRASASTGAPDTVDARGTRRSSVIEGSGRRPQRGVELRAPGDSASPPARNGARISIGSRARTSISRPARSEHQQGACAASARAPSGSPREMLNGRGCVCLRPAASSARTRGGSRSSTCPGPAPPRQCARHCRRCSVQPASAPSAPPGGFRRARRRMPMRIAADRMLRGRQARNSAPCARCASNSACCGGVTMSKP